MIIYRICLTVDIMAQKVEEFRKNVKSQLYSKLFYLPKLNDGDKERIALLDRIFWYPIDELPGAIRWAWYCGYFAKSGRYFRFLNISKFLDQKLNT